MGRKGGENGRSPKGSASFPKKTRKHMIVCRKGNGFGKRKIKQKGVKKLKRPKNQPPGRYSKELFSWGNHLTRHEMTTVNETEDKEGGNRSIQKREYGARNCRAQADKHTNSEASSSQMECREENKSGGTHEKNSTSSASRKGGRIWPNRKQHGKPTKVSQRSTFRERGALKRIRREPGTRDGKKIRKPQSGPA